MSPLPCPAAVSTSGTATMGRPGGRGWASRVTASATDGRDSSMNPPATAGMRPRVREPTRSTNRVNSATPSSLRVPCPTISNGGAPAGLIGSWVIGRFLHVEQGVEGGGRYRGATLLAAVGQRGQPAVPQRLFDLHGTHETHRQADD